MELRSRRLRAPARDEQEGTETSVSSDYTSTTAPATPVEEEYSSAVYHNHTDHSHEQLDASSADSGLGQETQDETSTASGTSTPGHPRTQQAIPVACRVCDVPLVDESHEDFEEVLINHYMTHVYTHSGIVMLGAEYFQGIEGFAQCGNCGAPAFKDRHGTCRSTYRRALRAQKDHATAASIPPPVPQVPVNIDSDHESPEAAAQAAAATDSDYNGSDSQSTASPVSPPPKEDDLSPIEAAFNQVQLDNGISPWHPVAKNARVTKAVKQQVLSTLADYVQACKEGKVQAPEKLRLENEFMLSAAKRAHGPRHVVRTNTAELSAKKRAARINDSVASYDLQKAATTVQSKGVVPYDQAVGQQLRQLHPDEAVPFTECTVQSGIVITEEAVVQAIKATNARKAAGQDAFSPAVIKACADDALFIENIVSLTQLCVDGKLPKCSRLRNATLLALRKDNGKVRPIAITSIVMRLIQRAIMQAPEVRKIMDGLAPLQLGCGQSAGKDAVLHMTSAWLEGGQDRVVLQLDLSNAYNTLSRKYLLKAIREREEWQCLLPFTTWLFSQQADLWIRSVDGIQTIKSQSGVKQGEPLSSLLFAMGLQLALEKANAAMTGTAAGFQDDTTLLATTMADAERGFQAFIAEASKAGLSVNGAKCKLLRASTMQSIPDPTPMADALAEAGVVEVDDGIVILGAPAGRADFVEASLNAPVNALDEWVKDLEDIADVTHQNRLLLLRICGLPRVTHLPQTCSPEDVAEPMRRAHHVIARAVGKLADWNSDLPAPAMYQVVQPIRFGGMGLTLYTEAHCAAALLSSAAKAHRLLSLRCSASSSGQTLHLALAPLGPQRTASINRAWDILKEANQLLAEPVQLPGSLDNPTKEVLEQLCDIQRDFTAAYAISLQQSTQAKLQEARQAAKQAAAESPDDNEAALNLLAAESKLAVLTAIGPADPKKPKVMNSLASKWLSAFPANKIFRLSNGDVRTGLRMLLLLKAYDGRDVCQCNKHHPMQIPHAITCGKVTGVQTTHKEVKTALVHVIRRCRAKTNLAEPLLKQYIGPHNPDAPVQPASDHAADHVPAEHSVQELATEVAEHTEPSNTYNLTHNPYVAKVKDMRGDLLVQHNATLSIVDVTIKSPLCTDIIEAACEKPGATAEKAERDKISKYKPFTDTKPATAFVPFGMEAYGRLGPAASKFLNDLWDHADVGAEVRPKLANYCLATLSVGGAERTCPVPGTNGPPLLVCLTDQSSR